MNTHTHLFNSDACAQINGENLRHKGEYIFVEIIFILILFLSNIIFFKFFQTKFSLIISKIYSTIIKILTPHDTQLLCL